MTKNTENEKNIQNSIPEVSKKEKKPKKEQVLKRPGLLHRKLDDIFGGLLNSSSRWEKEVAYLDSTEPKEKPVEKASEKATEKAVTEVTSEVVTKIDEVSAETAGEIADLKAETEDDPELLAEVSALEGEAQANANEAKGNISSAEEENVKIMNEQRNKIKEVLKNEDVNLSDENMDVISDGVREKIYEWNVLDGKDHFNDDHQIKEAYKQVSEERESQNSGGELSPETPNEEVIVVEPKKVLEENNESVVDDVGEKREFSDEEKEQMTGIKNIIKAEYPKDEDVSDEMAEKIKDIINGQNIKANNGEGADYFGDKEKTVDAYHQILEAEHSVVAEQVKNISELLNVGGENVSNKVIHDVRRKINEWNVMDAKNHFDNSDQIKEAYRQIKENIS